MRFFYLLLLVVTVTGCAIFSGKNTQSKWPLLQTSRTIECRSWPEHPKVLNIQDIKILGTSHFGLLARVTQRNGGMTNYYADFEGNTKLQGEDLQLRDFGSGSVVAGGGSIGEKVYAVVIPGVKNPGVMEVRSMEDNVVRYYARKLDTRIKVAKSYWAKKGIWLLYGSEVNDETSQEDLGLKLAYAEFVPGKQEMKLTVYRGQEFPQGAEVVKNGDSKAIVVWLEQDKKKAGLSMKMTEIDGGRQLVNPIRTVNLPLKSEVESWTIAGFADGILAAVVDGDSLVGQSVLRFSYVEWSNGVPSLKWSKEASLTNEHVSVPILTVSGRKALLIVPKWLDEESTVASYRIGVNGIEAINASGIFPKGSRVMGAFTDPLDKDVFGLVRSRGKLGWQFEFCNFEKL